MAMQPYWHCIKKWLGFNTTVNNRLIEESCFIFCQQTWIYFLYISPSRKAEQQVPLIPSLHSFREKYAFTNISTEVYCCTGYNLRCTEMGTETGTETRVGNDNLSCMETGTGQVFKQVQGWSRDGKQQLEMWRWFGCSEVSKYPNGMFRGQETAPIRSFRASLTTTSRNLKVGLVMETFPSTQTRMFWGRNITNVWSFRAS